MALNKKLRKLFKQLGMETAERKSRGCTTDDNAEVRAILDKNLVDGRIGVILSGRDCDCVSYHREYTMHQPNSVQAFKKHWNEHCDWLDGPESQHFVSPDEIDTRNNASRDLALEAFEDGHPHVVYA